jgi:hypothetical protein
MISLLYGQPGTGKSTLATGVALDYMRQGRRVVANYPIDPAPASLRRNGPLSSAFCEVIPARPTYATIQSLGLGWRHKDEYSREDRAGLLLIDEAGPWLDARKWQDKDRPLLIDWMLHSRKRGWDILFIAQAPNMIDKQVREAVVEAYARCRRLDRMKVPMTDIRLPRVHIAALKYGLEPGAPILERWFYRGTLEHKCYQSYALFDAENTEGHYCTLPPRMTKWAKVDSLREKFRNFFQPRRVVPRPSKKHPVADLISRLPPDERIKHWKRFESLGAFA